jgi:hypothetical protein
LSRQGAKREREGLGSDDEEQPFVVSQQPITTFAPKSQSAQIRKKNKIVIKKIKMQKAAQSIPENAKADVAGIPMVLDDLLKERQLVQPQETKPATFEGCQFFLLDIAKGDDLLGGLPKPSGAAPATPQETKVQTDPTCIKEEMNISTSALASNTRLHIVPPSDMAISA